MKKKILAAAVVIFFGSAATAQAEYLAWKTPDRAFTADTAQIEPQKPAGYVVQSFVFSESSHGAENGSDNGFRTTLGLSVHDAIDVEAAYTDHGNIGFGVDASAVSASLVHRRAVNARTELIGELGVARVTTETANETYHTTSPLVGAGLAYSLNETVNLEARYQHTLSAGKSSSEAGEFDISAASLGIKFDF